MIKKIKSLKYYIFMLLIGVFFLIPLFHQGFYLSHDGFAHVARFAAYFSSFRDGQIIPRWAGGLNSGYGTPLFIFFYPLPGSLASLIHLLGFNFETVFKIIIGFSFIFSSVFFFIWLKRFFKEEVAFAASVIYMVLPYKLLDIYVRGDIAETLSFVFIPLIFLFIDKSLKDKKISSIAFGGLFYGLFVMAHNGIALIFSPMLLIYALVFAKKIKDTIYPIFLFVLGLGISAFFWLPSILEGKYTLAKVVVANLYKINFLTISGLFYSNWGFGPQVNVKGGLSPQIGILFAIIPLITLFIVNRFKQKKQIAFWLVVFFISAFMTTSYSKLLWEKLPLINLLGYPWRLTILSGFSSCLIIAYLLNTFKNKFFLFAITALFVIFSLPFITVAKYIPGQSDGFYFSYQGTTDYSLRTDTIWTAGEFYLPAKDKITIIGGVGKISNLLRKSNIHTFNINGKTNLSILDSTVYFPGWKVTVDGVKENIQFQDMNHRGLIAFNVPSGSHKVSVRFLETPVRVISDVISLLAILLAAAVLIFNKRINRIIHK